MFCGMYLYFAKIWSEFGNIRETNECTVKLVHVQRKENFCGSFSWSARIYRAFRNFLERNETISVRCSSLHFRSWELTSRRSIERNCLRWGSNQKIWRMLLLQFSRKFWRETLSVVPKHPVHIEIPETKSCRSIELLVLNVCLNRNISGTLLLLSVYSTRKCNALLCRWIVNIKSLRGIKCLLIRV